MLEEHRRAIGDVRTGAQARRRSTARPALLEERWSAAFGDLWGWPGERGARHTRAMTATPGSQSTPATSATPDSRSAADPVDPADPRDPLGLAADAPLLAAWLSFTAQAEAGELLPMSVPGHKQRQDLVGAVIAGDAPLYGGLDAIKHADTLLADAEGRAAALWGADWCRFSVAGSTHGNQALALAVGQPGQEVIITRTLHRSLLLALVLAGLRPVWVRPGDRPAHQPAGAGPGAGGQGGAGRAPVGLRGDPGRPVLRGHHGQPLRSRRGRARGRGAAGGRRGLGRAPGLPPRPAAARHRGGRRRHGDQRAQGAARLHARARWCWPGPSGWTPRG